MNFKTSWACDGRISIASIRLMPSITITVIGSQRMNSPKIPETISIGENAAMVVRIVAVTGQNTSLAPLIVASQADSPFS